jgi:hypothetical protein
VADHSRLSALVVIHNEIDLPAEHAARLAHLLDADLGALDLVATVLGDGVGEPTFAPILSGSAPSAKQACKTISPETISPPRSRFRMINPPKY